MMEMGSDVSENLQKNDFVEVATEAEGSSSRDSNDIKSGEIEKLEGESPDVANITPMRWNPFDHALLERDFRCTPSLFQRKKKCKEETTFKWSIEHIAQLNPVEMEESDTEKFFSPGFEAKAKKVIDKYWETHYIPSPEVDQTPKSSGLRSRLPISALAKQETAEKDSSADEEVVEEENAET